MAELTEVNNEALERMVLQKAVEAFLYKEALLLDERKLSSKKSSRRAWGDRVPRSGFTFA
jgi:hypothetical protein